MKKVKNILGIGILSALFSTCFGNISTLSIIHTVDNNSSTNYGNSNGILLYDDTENYGGFKRGVGNYFLVYTGDGSVNPGRTNFWGGISNIGQTAQFRTNNTLPNFKFSYYSSVGFSLSGSYIDNGTSNYFSVFDFSNNHTFFGSLNLNYTHGDIFPTIYDFDTLEYLTFNNETTLAFNGNTYNFGNKGSLKYCFYGIEFDLSCVFYDSTLGYNYVNFSLNNDSIDVSEGYLIIPLNIDYTGNSFTGINTLILAPGINSTGGTDIIYNIIDLYSFDVSELKNGNIIDKGVVGVDIESFLTRSFLSSPVSTNTFTNGLGYFSEIFNYNGTYYYRSNSLITVQSNTTYYGVGKCFYHFQSCMGLGEVPMTSNFSVPDILNSNGGNGNESFPDPIFDGGVFDANTFLIEESIKCYLTSGEVCNSPFTYENSTNYVNTYDHQERIRNSIGKTGYLTFNNSVDMLSQYCLNVNTIQYAFCSQLSLYEGYPITYYYNNGYFNYIISGSGRQVNLGTLWSGQLGYAYCDGPYCSEFNQGLPQFIRKDTGDYSEFGFSGEYVSLDFFKNYFENGFFFQCPFSYSGSYFTIGSKLIDRLDKHDPLKPINCMIAGFSHGIKSSFFGDSKLGLSHSGVLMSNTGPNATRFYTFLDIVLSLGYIFLFSKLFKFLKKH